MTATNVLESVPYQEAGAGRRRLVDAPHLLVMQAALRPGQMVPQHQADSNVQILVLDGDILLNLDGQNVSARKGDLVPVAFRTPMNIRNVSSANATFLIIKAPHPSAMSAQHAAGNEAGSGRP